MDYEQYAERCAAAGKSTTGVATAAGVPKVTINRWKYGKGNPSPASMLKLETALQCIENTVPFRSKMTAEIIETADTIQANTVKATVNVSPTAEIDFVFQILSDKNRHKLLAYAYELYEEDLPKWPYKLENGDPYIPHDADEKS